VQAIKNIILVVSSLVEQDMRGKDRREILILQIFFASPFPLPPVRKSMRTNTSCGDSVQPIHRPEIHLEDETTAKAPKI
jgi:hypothetical protein